MDYPTNYEDYSFCMEKTGLNWTMLGAATFETTIYQPTLFFVCLPFIIFGVFSNILVLWIWLNVKTKFDDMVYLFRALAVADFLFVVNYPFAQFYLFRDIHMKTFFHIICFGNRPIAIQITLMLAIARFIRMFYPLHAQKILSHFYLSLSVMLIALFNLSVQTLLTGTHFFSPEKFSKYAYVIIKKGIMLVTPVLAQNVLMLLVVMKLMRFSRTVAPSSDGNVSHQPEQGKAMSKQENQEEQAHESKTLTAVQTGHMLALEHRETACDAGPQDPLTPVDTEETAQSDQTAGQLKTTQGAEETFQSDQTAGQLKTNQGEEETFQSDQTAGQLKTNQEIVVSEAELEILQQRDPFPENEPHKASTGHPMQRHVSVLSNEIRIDVQPVSATKKPQIGIDKRTIYVVLAICVSTFLEGMFCSIVRIIYRHLEIYKAPTWSLACNVIIIINHSINVVFYLFISSFRQTLLSKFGGYVYKVKSLSSVSMKATYPIRRGRIPLDSNRDLLTSARTENDTSYN